MKTWAGSEAHDFEYISRSIPSLLASELPAETELIIFDDHSSCPRLLAFLKQIEKSDRRVRVIYREENLGPNLGQQAAYEFVQAEYPDAAYYLNVDDDVIYHRHWHKALLAAKNNVTSAGINGVFTALNMPFRKPHSVIRAGGEKYLLKWKQPALNWLIPREVYEDVGCFRDEGIAYDTVYSHWMRLKDYSVIALVPSYVQNIGLLGAYARDDTATSRDFLGDGDGYSAYRRGVNVMRYTLNRIPRYLQQLTDTAAARLFPVRWGSEFVYEGVGRDRRPVAAFSVDEAMQLGWSRPAIVRRAMEVQRAQSDGPFAVKAVRHSLRGKPTWIECDWTFMPNLRECMQARPEPVTVDPAALFRDLLAQLLPLHRQSCVHNKIRQENVYVGQGNRRYYLAWLGTEPLAGVPLPENAAARVEQFSRALNRWALADTREQFTTRYLEAIAPEVFKGAQPTPRSDLFSAAAVVLLAQDNPLESLDGFRALRERWASGEFGSVARKMDAGLLTILRQCLNFDPGRRPADALAVKRALDL